MSRSASVSNNRDLASLLDQCASKTQTNSAGTANDVNLNGAYTQCLSQIAQALQDTDDYKILRRLQPHDDFTQVPADQLTKIGIVIDCETTGLDTRTAEIIELGMIRFAYTPDGRVTRALETFSAFREPSAPISKEIATLTGIGDEMVAGHHIDPEVVTAFLAGACIVLAHNCSFDRPFVERQWPEFQHVAWGCSLTQVDWRALGFESPRLGNLLNAIGLFHDGHRALDDARALLEILSFKLPTATTVLSLLLDKARRKTVRIWATGSPYEMKDQLKQRKYRWSDGSDGRPRSWFVDVDESLQSTEIEFLRSHIYCRDDMEFHIQKLDAYSRFSNRI